MVVCRWRLGRFCIRRDQVVGLRWRVVDGFCPQFWIAVVYSVEGMLSKAMNDFVAK